MIEKINKEPKWSFNDWHKTHGPNKRELWFIQNALCSILGTEDENCKQVVEAWNNSDDV